MPFPSHAIEPRHRAAIGCPGARRGVCGRVDGAGSVLLLVLLALFIQYTLNDWDLEAAAWTGDAFAPLAGYFSLLAVAAALNSVRLQSRALSAQIEDSQWQATSISIWQRPWTGKASQNSSQAWELMPNSWRG